MRVQMITSAAGVLALAVVVAAVLQLAVAPGVRQSVHTVVRQPARLPQRHVACTARADDGLLLSAIAANASSWERQARQQARLLQSVRSRASTLTASAQREHADMSVKLRSACTDLSAAMALQRTLGAHARASEQRAREAEQLAASRETERMRAEDDALAARSQLTERAELAMQHARRVEQLEAELQRRQEDAERRAATELVQHVERQRRQEDAERRAATELVQHVEAIGSAGGNDASVTTRMQNRSVRAVAIPATPLPGTIYAWAWVLSTNLLCCLMSAVATMWWWLRRSKEREGARVREMQHTLRAAEEAARAETQQALSSAKLTEAQRAEAMSALQAASDRHEASLAAARVEAANEIATERRMAKAARAEAREEAEAEAAAMANRLSAEAAMAQAAAVKAARAEARKEAETAVAGIAECPLRVVCDETPPPSGPVRRSSSIGSHHGRCATGCGKWAFEAGLCRTCGRGDADEPSTPSVVALRFVHGSTVASATGHDESPRPMPATPNASAATANTEAVAKAEAAEAHAAEMARACALRVAELEALHRQLDEVRAAMREADEARSEIVISPVDEELKARALAWEEELDQEMGRERERDALWAGSRGTAVRSLERELESAFGSAEASHEAAGEPSGAGGGGAAEVLEASGPEHAQQRLLTQMATLEADLDGARAQLDGQLLELEATKAALAAEKVALNGTSAELDCTRVAAQRELAASEAQLRAVVERSEAEVMAARTERAAAERRARTLAIGGTAGLALALGANLARGARTR